MKAYPKILLPLIFSCILHITDAQIPWSFLYQGDMEFPAAIARSGFTLPAEDAIIISGDIGSLELMDGYAFVAKLHASDGSVIWQKAIDKIGNIELGLDITQISDNRFLVSCLLFDSFRPWLVMLDSAGEELWSSESWSDFLDENIADKVMSFETPDGEIASNFFNAYSGNVYTYFLDEITGEVNSTYSFNLHDIFPDALFVVPNAMTHKSDNTYLITGYTISATGYTGFILEVDIAGETIVNYDDAYTTGQLPLTIYYDPIYGTLISGVEEITAGFFTTYNNVIAVYNAAGDLEYSFNSESDLDNSKAYAAKFVGGKIVFYNYVSVDNAWGSHPEDYVDVVEYDPITTASVSANLAYAESQIFENIIPGISSESFIMTGSLGDIGGSSDYFSVLYSNGISDIPACVFNCVWPGDANNDGIANTDDILTVGVLSGSAGPARADTSIDWYAHAAETWASPATGSEEIKYADSNGDGTINADDTTAVSVNYSSEHPVYVLKTAGGEIPLIIDAPETELPLGPNSLPVVLGDAINYADAIYGIRFTINYTSESVEAASVSFSNADSWFGAASDLILFRRNNTDNNKLDVAIVRQDQMNTSGYGEIGTLNFVVIDNIAGATESGTATFTITDVRAIDIDWNELAVEGSGVVVETEETTGISEQQQSPVHLYPNPATGDNMYLSGDKSLIENIIIRDITGKSLLEYSASEIANGEISIALLPAGAYIIEMVTQETVYTEKILRQ